MNLTNEQIEKAILWMSDFDMIEEVKTIFSALDLAQSVLSCRSVLGEPIGKADEFIPDDKEEAYRLGSKDAKDEDAVIVAKRLMGLKDVIAQELLPYADAEWRKDKFKFDDRVMKILSENIERAITDHITGGKE